MDGTTLLIVCLTVGVLVLGAWAGAVMIWRRLVDELHDEG